MAEEEFEKWANQYFSPEVMQEVKSNPVYKLIWCSGYDYRNKEVDNLKRVIDRLKSRQAPDSSTRQ